MIQFRRVFCSTCLHARNVKPPHSCMTSLNFHFDSTLLANTVVVEKDLLSRPNFRSTADFARETRLLFDSYRRDERSPVSAASSKPNITAMSLVVSHAVKTTNESRTDFLNKGLTKYFDDMKNWLTDEQQVDRGEFCKFIYRLSKLDYATKFQVVAVLGLPRIFEFAGLILEKSDCITDSDLEILVHGLEFFMRHTSESEDGELIETILLSYQPKLVDRCRRYVTNLKPVSQTLQRGEPRNDYKTENLSQPVSLNAIRLFQRLICRLNVKWPEDDVEQLANFLMSHLDQLFRIGQSRMCYFSLVNVCETFFALKIDRHAPNVQWVDKFLNKWTALNSQSSKPPTSQGNPLEAQFYYYFGLVCFKHKRFSAFSANRADWMLKMRRNMLFLTDEQLDVIRDAVAHAAVGEQDDTNNSKGFNDLFKAEIDAVLTRK